MSDPSKKRKASFQTYTSPAYLHQKRFKPHEKRVAHKNPLRTLQARQQTLTQIDFFLPLSSSDEELETDTVEDSEITPKATAGPCLDRRPPLSTVSNAGLKREKKDSNGECDSQKVAISSVELPKTPSKSRQSEVPCSQSSAGSPLSIRKLSRNKSPLRSPLKERSTNRPVQSPSSSSRRTLRRAPKLEIKSTYSWENESTLSTTSTLDPHESQTQFAKDATKCSPYNISNELPCQAASQRREPIKLEIQDSEDESEDGEYEDDTHINYQESQASSPGALKLDQGCPVRRSNDEEIKQEAGSNVIEAPPFHKVCEVAGQGRQSASHLTERPTSAVEEQSTLGAETDSCYQDGEHSLSNHLSQSSPLLSRRSLQTCRARKELASVGQERAIPEDSTISGFFRLSQASTVDITQPSSQHLLSSFSPPPIPASSPPPIRLHHHNHRHWEDELKGDDAMWTVSQLLPDSLERDSLIPPPPSTFIDDSDTE
ncbi:hypothetical protein L228DRAFT_248757 [Xylona heveae TC161]|uniref:Uncharacterized protein n=1 Tax=Xylona heveae (strain CBS 132557 / TC161) TaxID=1328760 RepID=A0A165FIG4_XYLHT|nr:hypothetical protein L228DRAFT_248757 [Xylona heveae TC161]KZF21013.1 hypothetical protein L228DRAFT_248757 [Xylona heveae TC161]